MAVISGQPVYVTRAETGASCGHDHASDVTGQLCLARKLDEARYHGLHGATFCLNRINPDGSEDVLRVMHA